MGHLVKIQAPEEFDVKRSKWSFAHPPVIPPYFELKPVDRTKAQLAAVVRQAKRPDPHTTCLRTNPATWMSRRET